METIKETKEEKNFIKSIEIDDLINETEYRLLTYDERMYIKNYLDENIQLVINLD